jgi:outer membrane receptor protein involved in Fe transport
MPTTAALLPRFLGAALILFVAGPVRAQSLAAGPGSPSAPSRTSDETVSLSPFVVATDKDNGYIAADTINAGRLSTNLLMTPGTMEVFTRDLLDDLGIFNTDEASAWLTSSHPLETNGINGNSMNPASLALHDSGSNVSLRGLATQPSTRNYFPSATTPMEYNVQRVEAGRGPNAILYGEGGPGGGVNFITKQAERRPFGSIRLRTDTLGSLGVAIDLNRPITEKLEARYNAGVMEQRTFIDRSRTKSFGHALSAAYRPWERTRVNVEADFTRVQRPGFIMSSYTDQSSDWNKVPVTGTLTAAQATAAGLTLRGSTGFLTYVEGLGMVELRNTAFTSGSGIPLLSSYPAGLADIRPPDKSFNVNPTDIDVRSSTADLQASVDHRFRSGLSVQLAAQHAKYRADGGNNPFAGALTDPNVTLPGGLPNPNFGKIYSASYLGRNIDGTFRDARTLRLVAAYPIKGFGGTTSLSAFGHLQEANSRVVYWDQKNADPRMTTAITDNNRRINLYRYWDNLPPSLPDFSKLYDLRAVPSADGYTEKRNDAVEVAASGEYLRGRLTFVAGFRRDKSELVSRNGDTASRDRVTGAFGTYTVEERVAFNNTKTVGAVYFPWERLGAYADYSEGFTIQTNAYPKLDGTFAGANIVPSKAESVGLRFRVARTDVLTIVGSAGFYQAEQNDSALSINVGAINTIWSNHRMPEKYLETFSASPTVTTTLNSIQSTRSYAGKGYEGSLTANVANTFRLVLNAAWPQTRQFATATDYRAYVAANLPQWEQWANDPTNATRTSDANQVRTIQNGINGFQDERVQNGTYKYRYNFTGVYTVRTGPLKGLRLGSGAQFYGPRVIGNQIDRPYDYVYSKAYFLVSGSLGYQVKLTRARLDLQLNVDNLLNHDDPMINGMFVVGTRLVPYGFRRMNPPELRLTSTLRF